MKPSSDSPDQPKPLLAIWCAGLLAATMAFLWLFKGPTDQELLANAAKAVDFHPWSAWWSPLFLGGASQAPGLTTLLSYLLLKVFMIPFGVVWGSKLAVLSMAMLGGWGVVVFLRRWTGDETAAWLAGAAYLLGPQMALRVAANEHLPVVFAMVFAPWVLWALLCLSRQSSWKNALILALWSAGMTLAFTKLAVVFAPLVAFFAVYLLVINRQGRKGMLIGLVRTLVFYVPLAVVVLLPTLREVKWLAMFKFDPFAAWQQNFALKSLISWLDRGNLLQQEMPAGYLADMGGFYVGVVALAIGLLAWWRASRDEEASSGLLPGSLKLLFGMLLFLSWMSAGSQSIAQGLLAFLKLAKDCPDITIPLFWIITAGQCVLLWYLWPEHARRDYARIAAMLVYLAVPGFRLYELLPFAHDIRAPWSVWQVGGSLVVAMLFGVGSSLLIKTLTTERGTAGFLALVFVVLMGGDYSIYLQRYAGGALPSGTYQAFEQIAAQLRQAPAGSIYPLSGRYFYLQLPALTGKAIEQEAFNSYFGLVWRRALQGASMSSPENIRTGLSLLGCSYIFIDKQDPNTPADLQRNFRSLFPVLFENPFFVVLGNPQSLYPAFFVRNFVAFPPESYGNAASAIMQLAPRNFVTVEVSGINQALPGFSGMAKGQNQVELLAQFDGKSGEPYARVPLEISNLAGSGRMVYQLPPTVSGWFVTTQAFHPDWSVTIDGKAAEASRADAALLATYVPTGSREVVFEFKAPVWYSLCLPLCALSWIAALTALFYLPSKSAPSHWKQRWEKTIA